jgi:hypothetical protein
LKPWLGYGDTPGSFQEYSGHIRIMVKIQPLFLYADLARLTGRGVVRGNGKKKVTI